MTPYEAWDPGAKDFFVVTDPGWDYMIRDAVEWGPPILRPVELEVL